MMYILTQGAHHHVYTHTGSTPSGSIYSHREHTIMHILTQGGDYYVVHTHTESIIM